MVDQQGKHDRIYMEGEHFEYPTFEGQQLSQVGRQKPTDSFSKTASCDSRSFSKEITFNLPQCKLPRYAVTDDSSVNGRYLSGPSKLTIRIKAQKALPLCCIQCKTPAFGYMILYSKLEERYLLPY